jgi:hypothetical protein
MLPTQKPKGDGWKSLIVGCRGGLDLNQDTLALAQNPGGAVALVNFEPSIYGGYRRINGYVKFDDDEVPGTGVIKGVKVFSGGVIACREDDVYYSTGSGWGSSIATRAGAVRYRFVRYNRTGTEYLIMVDEDNQPALWDGSTYTLLNGVGAPANPKYVEEYKNHIFYAGYTSNLGAVTWSAPLDETSFDAGDGAGELVVGDTVTGLKKFRETLYIFTRSRIYKLTGSSLSDFAVVPVTTGIGCIAPDSIQEIGGDLIFLAADGLRPLGATERIGDVEIATVSRAIYPLTITASTLSNICSVVVREKNQFRLFYNAASGTAPDARGVLGAFQHRQGHSQGSPDWEWSELRGIYPTVCDSHYLSATEYVIHGGYDGYVYRQEIGNSFDSANISAGFTTNPIFFDDPAVRKTLHKLTVYRRTEGDCNITIATTLDGGDSNVLQPASFLLTSTSSAFVYGSGSTLYGTATYGSAASGPATNNLHGSGFFAQLTFTSNDTNPSYTIQGFNIQYAIYGRR